MMLCNVRKLCVAGLASLLCLAPLAGARSQILRQTPDANLIRIQIAVNFFVAGPTDESEKSLALRDHASRVIYEMAAGECAALREKLADDCRLENVNVNFNRQPQQFGGQFTDGFQVNGTLGYRITPKSGVNP